MIKAVHNAAEVLMELDEMLVYRIFINETLSDLGEEELERELKKIFYHLLVS